MGGLPGLRILCELAGALVLFCCIYVLPLCLSVSLSCLFVISFIFVLACLRKENINGVSLLCRYVVWLVGLCVSFNLGVREEEVHRFTT